MSTEALADVFVQALNCGTAHRSVTHAQVETLAASHQPVIHVKQGSTHVMLLSTLDCGDAECTDARRRASDAEAAVESMQAAFEQLLGGQLKDEIQLALFLSEETVTHEAAHQGFTLKETNSMRQQNGK